MTNEQKFNAFMDAIGCKLVKDTDTMYRLEDHGYLVVNDSKEIFSTDVDGKLTLVPVDNGDELIDLLIENKPKWDGAYKRSADRRDPELPAEMFPSSLLPLDIDIAYQMQEKTLQPVVWSMDAFKQETFLVAELVVSPTRDGEQQLILASISYGEWAVEEGIPVCEPFREFEAYCKAAFDTVEKMQAFVDNNLPSPSGNLEYDLDAAIDAVWRCHQIEGIERSEELFWGNFVEARANCLAEKLIATAEEKGYSLTKHELVELGINDVCFGGKEYVKDDAPAEKTAKKAKEVVER